MPLYAGITPSSGEGGGGGSGGVGVLEDVGTIFATYIDPHQIEWPLSYIGDDPGWFTTDAIAGWGAGTYEIVTDPLSRGGVGVRFIRPQPGRLTWPVHIWGDDHLQFVERFRHLRTAFLKTVNLRLPGVLRVARPDGSAREIDVFYEDGFAGAAGEMWLSATCALTLFCPDSAWRDVEPVTVPRQYEPASSFFSPFLTISSSQVLGTTVITNPGDMDAWPVWTVHGPATQLVATNVTTGRTFTLTYTINSGETVTITTDRPAVRGPAGQNLSGALNWPTADLWGLYPGNNDIAFTVAGAGTGTKIELVFHPRYSGA